MKGTMPRGKNSVEDQLNYEALMYSHKDRAENVMMLIYYVMICQEFQKLEPSRFINCFIETYQTVYQMTSMVTGQLEDAISLHSILTAMFPCGSSLVRLNKVQ